jgi:hypothetical protein
MSINDILAQLWAVLISARKLDNASRADYRDRLAKVEYMQEECCV